MGDIAASDVNGLFTKVLAEVYQERPRPTRFLRSFFTEKEIRAKNVSIEVERMGEPIAVDVVRGTEGNRNTFSLRTEKIFSPPTFREYFDATNEDEYDLVLGALATDNSVLFARLMNKVADRLGILQDKEERAIELMCAQVFETGVVNIRMADTDIDFKRKAGSIVDLGGGAYWANNVDPFATLQAGCTFIRKYGRQAAQEYDAVLGEQAHTDLFANTKFLARQDLFNMRLDDVKSPVKNADGGVFHGRMTCGPYIVNLWTYPEYYKNTAGSIVTYLNTKKVFLTPSVNKRYMLNYCLVPQLISEPGMVPTQQKFVIGEFKDKRNATHEFDVQTRPLPVPVAVDTIYTVQVVA